MLAFNRLWRAKKNSNVRTLLRNQTGTACPQITTYKKDSVYPLYQLLLTTNNTNCNASGGGTAYSILHTLITSNGFQVIDDSAYDYQFPKGATLFTNGDINIDMLAVTSRHYANNVVSENTVQGYAYRVEKFDSVPYQRASFNDPDFGNNYNVPTLNAFVPFRDTLLGVSTYDFSLAGGGRDFFAAGLTGTTITRDVRLQNIRLSRVNSDSFAFERNIPEAGRVIGRELSTGFTGSSIFYDTPLITFGPSGTPVFSIADYYRSVRISPIDGGSELRWGAMGRAIGSAIYKNNFYRAEQPVLMLDAAGSDAIVAWRDNRSPASNTGNNIYMRHISNLDAINAQPPRMPVRLVPTPSGPIESNPYVLYGTSQAFTPIEYSTFNVEPSTTTLAEIFDNRYLGRVRTFIHQHTGTAVRTFNGQPYLNRNLTITTESTPSPGAEVRMRLYFTTTEFNALKAADNSIVTPGDLIIINQPYVLNTVPTTYTPVGNETRISPENWDSLPDGFYVQFNTARFGNFFLMKSATAHVCPGGNAAITASLSGATYQWQMDTGTGFADIATDPHVSGTNTATLQLMNVPSGWYGYKFRCMVDGSAADVVTLRFLANWTGATNTDWNNAANWGCGTVPDANTDVMVNSGSVILGTNGACRTLTVKPGATFRVSPGFNLMIMQ